MSLKTAQFSSRPFLFLLTVFYAIFFAHTGYHFTFLRSYSINDKFIMGILLLRFSTTFVLILQFFYQNLPFDSIDLLMSDF